MMMVVMNQQSCLDRYYRRRLLTQSEDHGMVGWESPESQRARFSVLAQSVPLQGVRLLDVGCGVGSLCGFLAEEGIVADYTGVDILADMTDRARRKYPQAGFVTGDALSARLFPEASFDVVFSSGVFNLEQGCDEDFLNRSLANLFGYSREWLVFNLLHEKSADREPEYRYYRPDAVRDTLRSCCPSSAEIRILDEYLPNDFTVIVRRAKSGRG